MKQWTRESVNLFGFISVLIIGTMLYTYLLLDSDVGILGFVILLIIVIASLFFGMRAGMTISVALLLFLFIYFRWFAPVYLEGSIQFYNLTGLSFTALLLMMSIVAGLIHELAQHVQLSQHALQEKARQLIAVDPETWLDNAERFQMDLTAERDRLVRHGGTFSVSFIHLNDFAHFEEHYGQTEYEWFLNYFSEELHLATRRTDHKYRIAQDTFAIIFPYTSPEAARVVHERIRPLLDQYELQNGNQITLDYEDHFYEVNQENCNDVVEQLFAKISTY